MPTGPRQASSHSPAAAGLTKSVHAYCRLAIITIAIERRAELKPAVVHVHGLDLLDLKRSDVLPRRWLSRATRRRTRRASTASRIPSRSPSSITAPTTASSSSGRPASTSCSIDVLCAPTFAAPAIRWSIEMRQLDAESSGDGFRFGHDLAHQVRDSGVLRHLHERGAGQRADRIERDIAEELDPDLLPDPRGDRSSGDRRESESARWRSSRSDLVPSGSPKLIRFPSVMPDDARLRELRREIGDRSDHAARLDRGGDHAARVDAFEPTVLRARRRDSGNTTTGRRFAC